MTSSLPGTTHAPETRTARRARRPLRTVAALAAGALLVVTGAGAAMADDINNALDTTYDGTLEIVDLTVGGPARTVELVVIPVTSKDLTVDAPGCNLAPGKEYRVDVVPQRGGIVEVSPTSLTFTSCDQRPTITVRGIAQGFDNVRLEERSNTTAGTFRFAGAAFTAVVGPALPPAPPANTPPTVAVTGVVDGGVYPVGQVPDAGCAVTDTQDGSWSSPATVTPVVWPRGVEGPGSQTATCTATDTGGLAAIPASATYAVTDPTRPTVEGTPLAGPDGLDGWYTSDVPVQWAVTEDESPESLVVDGCADEVLAQDGDAVTSSCTATSAGGTTQERVTVRRDATAPTVAVTSTTGTRGAGDWYTSPVTVTFGAQDATSGPATSAQEVTTTGEGVLTLTSPAFSDNAGNTTAAGAATQTVDVDLTNPSVRFDRTLALSVFGKVAPAPTCTATDAVSGPAGCVVTGYATTVGKHTLTATATDRAGRTATTTQSYLVLPWLARGFAQPVDMGGVLNVTKAGSTVPVRFELYAGLSKVTSTSAVTMSSTPITCNPKARTDTVETVTSGSTSLAYDSKAGSFLYTWKTPTQAGTCHRLTMTAADGTTLSADFRLK
jgi:hypothetical protein